MFIIDFYKLVTWLLPHWLRMPIIMVLIKSAIYPVTQLYEKFVQFRREKIYRLQHNSQVCYFRKVLNDRFDSIQRRIVISDFSGIERIFFYSDEELRDVYFGNHFFWPDSAYVKSKTNFTVKIPIDCAVTESEFQHLIAVINEYRLAGKHYDIVRT